MSRLAALTFWAAAAFALFMAVIPGGPDTPMNVSDKVLHAFAFFVLTGLGALAFRRSTLWRIALGLLVFGVGIEVVQGLPFVHRDASLFDVVADAAGIALACPLFAALLRRWRATATA